MSVKISGIVCCSLCGITWQHSMHSRFLDKNECLCQTTILTPTNDKNNDPPAASVLFWQNAPHAKMFVSSPFCTDICLYMSQDVPKQSFFPLQLLTVKISINHRTRRTTPPLLIQQTFHYANIEVCPLIAFFFSKNGRGIVRRSFACVNTAGWKMRAK